MTAVRYEASGGIGEVVLSDKDGRNALSVEMAEALLEVMRCATADPTTRVICFRSDLRNAFSMGVKGLVESLRETNGLERIDRLAAHLNSCILALASCPKPTVVAMHSYAFGGGLNLFLAGDIRLATETTLFVENFLRMGVTPDLSSTYFLPKYVGFGRALDILIRRPQFSGTEALAWGLVSEVMPSKADLRRRTREIAEDVATMPKVRALETRRLLHGDDFLASLALHLDRERQQFVASLAREDALSSLEDALRRMGAPAQEG